MTAIRPGRLSLKRAQLLISFFIFSEIFLALSLKLEVSVLISMPRIVALCRISNPRSRMLAGISSSTPIGIRTVFSMLQRKPDTVFPQIVLKLLLSYLGSLGPLVQGSWHHPPSRRPLSACYLPRLGDVHLGSLASL